LILVLLTLAITFGHDELMAQSEVDEPETQGTDEGQIQGPQTVIWVVLSEEELLGSEQRLQRARISELEEGGIEVILQDAVSSTRREQLESWITTSSFEERAQIPISSALLTQGVAILVRWNPPVSRRSQGTSHVAVVRSTATGEIEEIFWMQAQLAGRSVDEPVLLYPVELALERQEPQEQEP